MEVRFHKLVVIHFGLGYRWFKQIIALFDLAPNCKLLREIFERIGEDLLEDHDDNQIDHQRVEVLEVHDGNEVRDVIVDELEHEGLICDRVFELLLVAMILVLD